MEFGKINRAIIPLFIVISLIVINNIGIPKEIEDFRVIKVIDGDTFKISYKNRVLTIRIFGIDCPEVEKEKRWFLKYLKNYGNWVNIKCLKKISIEAKNFLEEVLRRYKIKIRVIKRDRYNRLLAIVYNCSFNLNYCEDLNKYFLSNGLAIVYVFERNIPRNYYKFMEVAINRSIGLWKCIK